MLTRTEISTTLSEWYKAWDNHDLETVMDLFHEEIYFENWTGGNVRGKEELRASWLGWFENHGGFIFIEEDTFIDEVEQKALFQWTLEWPSIEPAAKGKRERRKGIDVLCFKDGKIITKLTYSKTSIEIDGERRALTL